MREKRIKESNSQLNKQEMDWWDSNAKIIEKIWAMNYEFQRIIRLPYLKKMKKFFKSDIKKPPLIILEVGCGTGWVCRMIADEDLHIIGTDFSTGQLSIAKEQAKLFNKIKFCTYELADASSFKKNIDGVVIHALMHHLSEEELKLFIEELSKLPPDTKVFLYEPVFIKHQASKPSIRDKILNKIITKLKRISIKRAQKLGSMDTELKNEIENIYEEAKNKGWFISPKEVPFYEDELNNYLLPIFNINKKYIVNKSDLDISQELIINKIEKPDFVFSRVLIPLSAWLDKLAFKGNYTSYLAPLTYQFVCFELTRKH